MGSVDGLAILLVAHTIYEDEEDDGQAYEVIRIISARKADPKDDVMKKSADMVRYEVDKNSLPPLTDKQKAELAALSELPDEQIDYRDVPGWTDEQLQNAGRGRFYRPLKQQITARVDADVVDWLKSQGKGYQARMNAILRREMLASLKSQKRT
ncbi:BrnA antitoxin family protein [Neorhizobium galegae]|uniref:BrnA antitoxin family protein n=1 Tax=Neorhizobium galegae TaxID=399 RepID=UPI003D7BA4E7